MNIDVDNPQRNARYRVSFVIQSPSLDLDAISRTLDIVPSHTHRVGDLSRAKKILPHDMWRLTSPPTGPEESIDAHLKWLAEKLKPHYDFIRSLKNHAEIYIFCGYTIDTEQSGFSLSSEALALVTDIGISMDFSILAI
jgi:hypothetical protein